MGLTYKLSYLKTIIVVSTFEIHFRMCHFEGYFFYCIKIIFMGEIVGMIMKLFFMYFIWTYNEW